MNHHKIAFIYPISSISSLLDHFADPEDPDVKDSPEFEDDLDHKVWKIDHNKSQKSVNEHLLAQTHSRQHENVHCL